MPFGTHVQPETFRSRSACPPAARHAMTWSVMSPQSRSRPPCRTVHRPSVGERDGPREMASHVPPEVTRSSRTAKRLNSPPVHAASSLEGPTIARRLRRPQQRRRPLSRRGGWAGVPGIADNWRCGRRRSRSTTTFARSVVCIFAPDARPLLVLHAGYAAFPFPRRRVDPLCPRPIRPSSSRQ